MKTVCKLLWHWMLYLLVLCGFGAFAVNYTAWFSAYIFRLVLLLPLFSLLVTLPPLLSLSFVFEEPASPHRGEEAALFLKPTYKGKHPYPYYLPVTVILSQIYLCDAPAAIPTPQANDTHRRLPFLRRKSVSSDYDISWKLTPYPMRKGKKNMLGGSLRIPMDTTHTSVIRTILSRAFLFDPLGLFCFSVPAFRGRKERSQPIAVSDTVVLPLTQKPRNKMRMWSTAAATLVPTQKPSEQYEIRDYRPGDALRAVHWKLSAKMDDLLVCESVEPAYKTLAITIDRPTDPTLADCVYDALDWVLRSLSKKEHAGVVICAWVNEAGRTCTETVRNTDELSSLYLHMLSDRVPDAISAHAFASVYRMCDRGYHLDAETCMP